MAERDEIEDDDAPFIWLPHDVLMGHQRQKNAILSAAMKKIAGHLPEPSSPDRDARRAALREKK